MQSPKEYKRANGENYNSGFHSSDTPKWSAVQIKRILTNEFYIGNMVQGKQERISYKVKQRLDKPESEWVKVENTHPAIIRQNDFDVVQKLLQYNSFQHLFRNAVSGAISTFIFCLANIKGFFLSLILIYPAYHRCMAISAKYKT